MFPRVMLMFALIAGAIVILACEKVKPPETILMNEVTVTARTPKKAAHRKKNAAPPKIAKLSQDR